MSIISSSVVALELAQVFHRLNAKVSVVARSTLLSKQDPQLCTALSKIFEYEGIRVLLHTSTDSVRHDGKQFTLKTNHGVLCGDRLHGATGRTPNYCPHVRLKSLINHFE